MAKKAIDCGTLRIMCDSFLDNVPDSLYPFTKSQIIDLKHFLSMYGYSKTIYLCNFNPNIYKYKRNKGTIKR